MAKDIQAEVILDCVAAKNKGKKTPLTLEQWFQRKESSAFGLLDEMRRQIAARSFDKGALLRLRGTYSKSFTGTNYAPCFRPLDDWPDGADVIRVAPQRPNAAPAHAEPPSLDKAPVHDHWVAVVDEATGKTTYVKPSSGEVAPFRPAGAGSEEGGRAADWLVCHDTVFKVDYYYNKVTKVSTWSRPAVLPDSAISDEEFRKRVAKDPLQDRQVEADLRHRIARNPLYASQDRTTYVSMKDKGGLDTYLKGKPSYEALRDEDGEIENSKVGTVFVIQNGVIRETLWTHTSTESGGVVKTVSVPTKTVTLQNSNTIDSITASARLMFPYFCDLIETITKKTGGNPIIPGLKGLQRSGEKVVADYKGDASRMVDILRASIVYDTIPQALLGFHTIRNMAEDASFKELKALAEIKQRFKETPEERATDRGYKDINLQLVLPNSLVAELQITVRALAEIKEFDKIQGSSPDWVKSQAHHGSHRPYEVMRQLEALTPQQRDELLPDLGKGDLAGASGGRIYELATDLQYTMVQTTIPKAEAGEFLTEKDANYWRNQPVYLALDAWLDRLEKVKAERQ
jgi:hypothetical protein